MCYNEYANLKDGRDKAMASYRYTKDIDPQDLQEATAPEYSKKDKMKNWWHYNWKWLAAALVGLAVVFSLVLDIVRKKDPDITLGIVTEQPLPQGLLEKMEQGLSQVSTGFRGKDVPLTSIEVFSVQTGEEAASLSQPADSGFVQGNPTDPYAQMAGVVRLSAALGADDILVFMVPPQGDNYQQMMGLFECPGGGDCPVEDVTVAWKDVPALAAMDLKFEDLNGNVYDGQQIIGDYRIGMRSLDNKALQDSKTALEDWQALSALLAQGAGKPMPWQS